MTQLLAAVRTPTGPAFTVVLVGHVASVLLALVVTAAGAVAAVRVLRAKGDLSRSVRAYFSPGVNWAGRVLYLVPVFGAALVAMSGGAYGFGAAWVDWGIVLWVASAALAEAVLWPAERRVQRGLASTGSPAVPGAVHGPPVPDAARRACRTMCLATAGVVALIVAAMVVMFAKP
ncbi:MAG TPA: hypothetical protein VMD28_01600 [Acidimicrobiales bacterium]|nr:hypothetical protein [Acidimicrobiales bacterium]